MQPGERMIDAGGIALRAIEAGEGPLVLMIHGFPGLAWSWRHQLAPLAAAGGHAVAIDCPGYRGSDRPLDPAAYDANRMQACLLAVLDAFGAEQAVIVGQAAIRGTAAWLGIVQAADVPGRVEPGAGRLDWRAIAAALGAAGHDGLVELELEPIDAGAAGERAMLARLAGLGWLAPPG